MPISVDDRTRRARRSATLLVPAVALACWALAATPSAADPRNVPIPEPDRAFLGVSIVRGVGEGVHVGKVIPGSAADRAGVQAGDVIVGIGRQPLVDRGELFEYLAGLEPGEEVAVTVLRDGVERRLDVELGGRGGKIRIDLDGTFTMVSPRRRGTVEGTLYLEEGEAEKIYVCQAENCQYSGAEPVWYRVDCIGRGCPTFQIEYFNRPMLGVRLVDRVRSLDSHPATDRQGVLVGEVFAGGPADLAGLAEGDLIVGLDDEVITGPGDLRRALDASSGGVMELGVVRDGEEVRLRLRMADRQRATR